MNIKLETKIVKKVSFGELFSGDTFLSFFAEHQTNPMSWMKICPIKVNGIKRNAVSLHTGGLAFFLGVDYIIPIEIDATVKVSYDD